MGGRAPLTFRKFKGDLNPTYRVLSGFAVSITLSNNKANKLVHHYPNIPFARQTSLHDSPTSPFTVIKAFKGGQWFWKQKSYTPKNYVNKFVLNISKEGSTLNAYLLTQIWKPSYNQVFFLSKRTLKELRHGQTVWKVQPKFFNFVVCNPC